MAIGLCYLCLASFVVLMAFRGQWSLNVTGTPGMVRMICEMTAGCLLYGSFSAGLRVGNFGSLAALILFGIGVLVPNANAAALFAIPLILLGAAKNGTAIERALSCRIGVFLDEVSFSIYLTHWIVLQAANRILPSTTDMGFLTTVRILGIGALVIGISVLTYRTIELPSRQWGRAFNLRPLTETS